MAFISAAVLLTLMGTLLIAEDRTGIVLFPVALIMLALAAITLGCGLAGLTIQVRRHRQRGGRTALIASGAGVAGGGLLAVMVAVGLATGGITGEAPAAVDRLAAIAMVALVGGTFVGMTTTGISIVRSAIPSRAVGSTLTIAGLLFLVPLSIEVLGFNRPPEGALIALFATWTVLFAGTGIALRRT